MEERGEKLKEVEQEEDEEDEEDKEEEEEEEEEQDKKIYTQEHVECMRKNMQYQVVKYKNDYSAQMHEFSVKEKKRTLS